MEKYDPAVIEPKWQKVWEKSGLYKTPEPSKDHPKKYILDMYPYPSGAVLHVGHMEGYVATDVVSRYLRMKGFSVLHPMGWDAFGLPAENYAIKTGIHPDKSTHDNINTFRKQLQMLGLSYDWEREVDTSDPSYYKWTQWLFTVLFKMGLAYKKKAPANWCPKDETVLANEQVENGRCERCGTEVVQKDLDQWFFKITAYADQLIEGLDRIDWPKSTKLMQKNWIGRKDGINVTYEIADSNEKVEVFTTAPVNFGMTFLVLSPEHALTKKIIGGEVAVPDENRKAVADYVDKSIRKTERERVEEGKEKTGVFTGLYAINWINNKKVPVWVTDFVLGQVGTGAVQGCPGHDKKDFQFAKKFGLPIPRVVVSEDGYDGPIEREDQVVEHGMNGHFVNSEFLDGLNFEEGLQKTMDYFEENGWGKRVSTYHLRDWLVSRQRYWGAPIPMVWCPACAKASAGKENAGWQPVPEADLPVLLPTDVDFRPSGESPIARSKTFQEGAKCPKCGGKATREVDTMDTFVDSSWYFLAFTCAQGLNQMKSDKTDNLFHKYRKEIEKWMPVDIYVGGGHTVQHLLFARFFEKALVDAGYIDRETDEPFLRLEVPGWISGPDSRKMSKRWNNVITPDDVVKQYGADTMRMYEMFMAPFSVDKPWNVDSVAGVNRFIAKIWVYFCDLKHKLDDKATVRLVQELERMIAKVGIDIEEFRFNISVAAFMEFYRNIPGEMGAGSGEREESSLTNRDVWKKFVLVLAPFAPHLAEELWEKLGEKGSVHEQVWPEVSGVGLRSEGATVVVMIDGKPRSVLKFSSEDVQALDKVRVEETAKSENNVAKHLEGKRVKTVVYVPGKVINFVTE